MTSIEPSSTTKNLVDGSPCSNRISPPWKARSWPAARMRSICGASSVGDAWARRTSAGDAVGPATTASLRQEAVVDVAPGPGLAGFDRGDDRMAARVEVLG